MARIEGKTLDDVLEQYSKENNISKDKLSYKVLEEKKGLLGLGSHVVVEISSSKDVEEFLEEYLKKFFKDMDMDISTDITYEEADDIYKVNISADNNAIIIGKNGRTLQALNTVLKGAASNKFQRRVRVLLDINGYKEERYSRLEYTALQVAKSVQETKQSALLDPMSSDERRIVHQYLGTMDHIKTVSEGEGRNRRIRIVYDENATKE